MTGERYELNDMTRFSSERKLTEEKKFARGGCYLSTALGFVLVLLAVLIAVGVGIVVYFASAREVVCKCGTVDLNNGMVSPEVMQQCKKLADGGNKDICEACLQAKDITTLPTSPQEARLTDVRLPTHLQPLYYHLQLQPFMYSGNQDEFFFRGYVSIVIRCLQASANVTLHSNKLNITGGSLSFSSLKPSPSDPVLTSWREDKERQFLIIHLNADMQVGQYYTVTLNFTGPLKDDLHGLYVSSYQRNNKTIYLATTQFQPTDARKAFPCFDEPAFKSHFNVTLLRPTHLTSLSNMPVKDSSHTWVEDGIQWVADVYQTTPKMSTYLLAFVISDFVNLNSTTTNNVTYRVWTKPESIQQAQYALEVGVKVLSFFESFYQLPYPLPKQDMIAVPDFAAGAMENWGLITYRETTMLYQPGVSSVADKQRVAIVVAHELAHQWFGDLVTPSWWDDLWLNEGFATLMQYVGVDFIHPDWNMFQQFAVEGVLEVFDVDGLVTSHPIYVPVYHPDEINEIFDRISYGKGACVIAMMKHFLGESTFNKGLTNYLRGLEYGAAFHDDLWMAMSQQAEDDGKTINVKAIMDTWTLQMNFPIVTLTQSDKNTVKVTQSRFLQDSTALDPGKYESPFGYKWNIPVTLTSSQERNFNKTHADVHWLWESASEHWIKLPGILPDPADGTGWILGNIGLHGYYRVNYPESNWQALSKQLSSIHSVIPPINRAQIISDAWNLARGNYLALEIALETVHYLHQEMDYIPWAVAGDQLSYLDSMLARTGLYGAFQKFMRSKIDPPFLKLGMNNTGASHLQSFQRSLLVSKACYYENPQCVSNATNLFRQWMTEPNTNPIDAGMKSTVYCTAIKQGDVTEWDFTFQQYRACDVAAEKFSYLQMALNQAEIRKQDALRVVGYIASNQIGRTLAWEHVRGNWKHIRSQFGASFFTFSSLINAVTSSFNTQFELQQLEVFLKMYPDQGSGKRAFQQALEKTRSNVAWIDKNYDILKRWLQTQNL